jgi:hypothetical protein
MNTICVKIQFFIIALALYLLFPLVTLANTNVTLLNASGGAGGATFFDMAGERGRVSSITVRSGNLIDNIRFTYRYGNKLVNGLAHGGKGGKSSKFRLKPGEVITEMWGRSGKYVDSLNIKTSMGRVKRWGGQGGHKAFRFKGSKQAPIIGVWGRSGALIDAIGAVRIYKAGQNNGGGQGMASKGFAGFKQKVDPPGGTESCDRCENVAGLQFPNPSAEKRQLKPWLKNHSAYLGKIINRLSASDQEFDSFIREENRLCRSRLYCKVAYRLKAISYVTGVR